MISFWWACDDWERLSHKERFYKKVISPYYGSGTLLSEHLLKEMMCRNDCILLPIFPNINLSLTRLLNLAAK